MAKSGELFVCQPLQRLAQQDKTNIAVLSASARRSFQRQSAGSMKNFLTLRLLEKASMRRQARRVGKQHAKSHLPGARVGIANQFRQNCCRRRIQVEEAALVE